MNFAFFALLCSNYLEYIFNVCFRLFIGSAENYNVEFRTMYYSYGRKEFKDLERLPSEIQGVRITPSSIPSGLKTVEFEDH